MDNVEYSVLSVLTFEFNPSSWLNALFTFKVRTFLSFLFIFGIRVITIFGFVLLYIYIYLVIYLFIYLFIYFFYAFNYKFMLNDELFALPFCFFSAKNLLRLLSLCNVDFFGSFTMTSSLATFFGLDSQLRLADLKQNSVDQDILYLGILFFCRLLLCLY
jgi:hypothetical protein